MSQKRVILRNIASNWIGYFVNVVVGLALMPFVLHAIGDELYGLWALIINVTGYYGLLDLGVRSAVGQYVTRYWALGDMKGVNRTLNTAFVLLGGVALLGIAASGVAAWWLPSWFHVSSSQASSMQWAMLIMGVGISLGLPMAIYGTATVATQRFDASNIIAIATRLLSAGLIVWVLKAGDGLLGLAVVEVGCRILDWFARMLLAYRLMPGLGFSLRFSRDSFREIGTYSVFSFLIRIAYQIIDMTDLIVVGIFMPPVAITYYAVGANLLPYYNSMVASITQTFTPHATTCHTKGDVEGLRRTLLLGTRGAFAVASVVAGGMLFLGGDFLRLWVGPKYLLGTPYASSAVILGILTVASLIRRSQSCGMQVLFGMGNIRIMSAISVAEAVVNLGCSLLLVRHYGLIGVAVGTLVPAAIFQGLVFPYYMLRKVDVGWPQFLRQALVSGTCLLAMIGIFSYVVGWAIVPRNWLEFFCKAGAVLCAAVLFGGWIGTNKSERGIAWAWLKAKSGARLTNV